MHRTATGEQLVLFQLIPPPAKEVFEKPATSGAGRSRPPPAAGLYTRPLYVRSLPSASPLMSSQFFLRALAKNARAKLAGIETVRSG